ncbi:alpha-1,6-mannanase [Bacteroidia bacterium]|nr:alpha-1,6-mannanase [Bacteroidia bacterium]
MKKFCFYVLMLSLFTTCGNDNNPVSGDDDEPKIDWTAAADSSSKAFVTTFWNAVGYFNYNNSGNTEFGYWPQAHALDVITDAYIRTGDNFYKAYYDNWYNGVKMKNRNTFYNEYYDDMEWNALAMLRAYKATGDIKFKEATLQVWEWIIEGWNMDAGGGIYWKRGDFTKNACSNGPACILAARLYQEFGNPDDKEWATKIYGWEKTTLFNSNNGMVYDNIDNGVINNWVFTYNQGTFVGSAVELHKIFGEKAYLNDAVKAADYTISSLVDNSILKSEGTGDGGLFKGIFIRYFTELIQQDRLDAPVKKRYVQFIRQNAETLWTQGTTKPAVLYGPNWRTKPGVTTGLTEQTSGCMLIEAMALLKNKGIL